jgi:azurin
MKTFKLIFVGIGILFLSQLTGVIGRFLYVMTDTSFGPAGGSHLLPHYVPRLPTLAPQSTYLCEGITFGRWIGCDLVITEKASTALITAQPSPVEKGTDSNLSEKRPDSIIEIGTDGESLAFNKTEFKVKANSVVLIKFKNNAVQTKMPHNLVIVLEGSEAKVANAGIAAGEAKNWVPELPDVVAHTRLVAGGAQAEVQFKAPNVGKYPFICTFPGHYLSMKGTMRVE